MKLYRKLEKKLDQEKSFDLLYYCKIINQLDKNFDKSISLEHYKWIYLLILRFFEKTQGTIETIDCQKQPYNIKIMPGGKGVLCELNKFPEQLQRIICLYVDNYLLG